MASEVKLEPVTAAFEGSRLWWLELSERAAGANVLLPSDPNDSFYRALFAIQAVRVLGFATEAVDHFQNIHSDLEDYAREFVDAWWDAEAEGTTFTGCSSDSLPYLLEESMGVDSLFPIPAMVGSEIEAGDWTACQGWQLLVDTFESMIARVGAIETTSQSALDLYLEDILRVDNSTWVEEKTGLLLACEMLFRH